MFDERQGVTGAGKEGTANECLRDLKRFLYVLQEYVFRWRGLKHMQIINRSIPHLFFKTIFFKK